MSRFVLTMAAAVVVLAACGICAAGASPELSVKTSRVVIYKDGTCMFIKDVTGTPDAQGRAVIRDVPECVSLGTFWLTDEKGGAVASVASQETVMRKGRGELRKTLEVSFAPPRAPGAPRRLTLQHFGPGIRWVPTYRIVLGADGQARILMQAEILNEVEDLRGVVADLVVGVPNFRFKDVASPMTLEGTLRNYLVIAAPALMSPNFSNALMTQRIGEFRGDMGAPAAPTGPASGVPALPGDLVGEGAQDLFTYHLPNLDLDVGEGAAVPVLSANVPFRHLYSWDLHVGRSAAEALPGAGAHASPVRLLKNDIWHLIELTNNTTVPWTTGAALALDGYLPVGQELLTYTSVGGKCQLPLTVAIDVRGTFAEEEVGRELKAIRYNGYDFARITKRGTLRITNYKKEPVTLVVSAALGGNVAKASDDGRISIKDGDPRDWASGYAVNLALNGHSMIQWEITLAPGQARDLTCEYAYYTL